MKEILEQMQLLVGPPERLRIKNVALMMFCDHPDKFFPYMEADIVKFPNGSVNDPNNFIEIPPIKGTVPQIIRKTMDKLQSMVIEERVQKVGNKMEANRIVNCPYAALEEAVVNAFYHRDYMSYEPVHIEIEPDCVNIISYPGIDRSIPMDVIQKGERFRTRVCRNRRLGEFLKELHLTEGKCTGVPTIQEELEKIGSPKAVFDTDTERRSVCVSIPICKIDIEKENIQNENVVIQNGNVDIDVKKSDIQAGNADIQNKNADIQNENADIDERKSAFNNIIKRSSFNKNTVENINLLINHFDMDVVFGREDIITLIECGHTAATNLLQKMIRVGIIESVKGYGKGRYKLRKYW